MIAVGVVSGIVVAALLTRVMRGLVFGVTTVDATTFLLVTVFLAAVALVATWIPARRALSVEPITAIRAE